MNNFTKLGFILATLGSSIGLGHIWRFPYMTGEYGGSAFVIVYIWLTILIGIPILVAKMLIGNKSQKDIFSAFKMLDKSQKRHWSKASIMMIGGPLILAIYSVVLGWAFYYLSIVSFNLPSDIDNAKSIFGDLQTKSFLTSLVSFGICMFCTAFIVSKGIKNGLEKYNLILMPLLFLIFIGIFFYAMSMESFGRALKFLFSFDLSKITPSVFIMALSQVFFSLSLGVGTIIAYSSSAKKGENLLTSAAWIALSGIVISLIAGVIVFTFLFNANQPPSAGPGMLFISLTSVFGNMAYGNLVSFLFFLAVLFAGITSAISMLEPSVAFLENYTKLSRAKISYGLCGVIFVIGVFVILSFHEDYGKYLTFFGKILFDWIDFVTAAVIMPLGALFSLIFVGYVVEKKFVYKFVRKFMSRTIFNIWYVIIRYIAPFVIVLILVAKFVDKFIVKIGVGL